MTILAPSIPEFRFRHFARIAPVLLLLFAMASCSNSDSSDSGAQSSSSVSSSDEEPGGISLSQLFGLNNQSQGLPVNALLWRASLDTLAVIPLSSVDTFGGTIISEWYANPSVSNQRIKVTVFVLDQELRSDGVKVEVYVQEPSSDSAGWVDAGRDIELATRLEELILTRAREIRSSGISETN